MKLVIPRVKFLYSPFYEKLLTGRFLNLKERKEVLRFKKELEKRWKKIEKKIFKKLFELTKFTFDGWKEIECYLVKNFKFSFAPPATLKVRKNLDFSIAILVHEIFHLLLLLNERKFEKLKKSLKREYQNFSEGELSHFFILSLELEILKEIFGKDKGAKIFKMFKEIGFPEIVKEVLKTKEGAKSSLY